MPKKQALKIMNHRIIPAFNRRPKITATKKQARDILRAGAIGILPERLTGRTVNFGEKHEFAFRVEVWDRRYEMTDKVLCADGHFSWNGDPSSV